MRHASFDEVLRKLEPLTCRADLAIGATQVLKSNGVAVSTATRDELLVKARAGEYVELDLEVLAFEQTAGTMNRNYIRFRDGALMAMGRTGRDKPFLRDHEQYDVNARAGTILASDTTKRGEGDYEIRMTARLTAPWAVELALRGLLSTVSIGWNPTGPVECSVCNAARFTKCYHFPGDRLRETTDSDGNTIKVRDRNGPIIVEWVYTAAELTECSVVSVPAVPGAHIDGIRAALAAARPDFSALAPDEGDGFPEETNKMKFSQALAAILCLAATASEDDIIKATEALKKERDSTKAELGIAQKELDLANAENAILSGENKTSAADKFIADALASGRIVVGAEPEWREMYKLSPARAEELMAKKKEGSASPVGAPRQSKTDPEPKVAATTGAGAELATQVNAGLAKAGIDGNEVVQFATMFGAKKPVETIAAGLGLKKGA